MPDVVPEIVSILRLFFCERCVDEHGSNPQSVSCYCSCHNSERDEERWESVKADVLKALNDQR